MNLSTPSLLDRDERLDEAVVAYLEAVEAGEKPDRVQWLARYPDLASDLNIFFADQDRVADWTDPLREVGRRRTPGPDDPQRTTGVFLGAASAVPLGPFGDYELLEEIARGGMGIVYKARHLRLGRIVALKMILAEAACSPEELQRFRAEAEAAAHLDHPHIVPIYDVGEHEQRPYFTMKLIEGGNLAQHLGDFVGQPRAAAALLAQAARAVHHAHQHGVLHRDLNPANILLQKSEIRSTKPETRAGNSVSDFGFRVSDFRAAVEPVITDFGLAKRTTLPGEASLTRSGVIIGTPSYMAPEQAAGKKGLTTAADVYALGAILYECLTGRVPFRAETPLETLLLVLEQEPPPPRALRPELDRDLETICLRCLQKDPLRRYPTSLALAEDLERYLAGETIQARPAALWERGVKWTKRRPVLAAVLLGLVLALLGSAVGGFLYLDQRARRTARELQDQRRVQERRDEVQHLLFLGQQAAAGQRWEEARDHLRHARAVIGTEPSLVDLEEPVRGVLAEVTTQLDRQSARRQADTTFRRFGRLRDQALFHGALFSGLDLPANLDATRTAIRAALDLLGLSESVIGSPTLDPAFSDRERAEIRAGCYELVLLLAEAVDRKEGPDAHRQAVAVLDRALAFGSPSRTYHLRRARYLRAVGDASGATEEMARAEALPPASALDHFLLGEDLQRQGNVPAAVREFESTLLHQPGHFWARYFLAVCALRLQRPGEARAHLTACIDQKPDLVWSYLLRGFALGQQHEYALAEVDFQKALEDGPNEEARYALFVNRGALRARQARSRDGAVGVAAGVLAPGPWSRLVAIGTFQGWQQEKLTAAVADLQDAIALKPDWYQAHANLANVHVQQERLDRAVAELDQALRTAGALVEARRLEPDALAHLHHQRGRVEGQRGRLDAALRDFDEALHPGAADHAERGRVLHRREQYQEAVAAYDAALRFPAVAPDVHRWKAEALLRLHSYREASEALDEYLAKGGSGSAEVYLARGLTRAELRRYNDAVADYDRALALRPNDARIVTYRGWVYALRQAPQLALEDFTTALRLEPNNGSACNGRGYVLARLGRLTEAIDDVEKALRIGPEEARTYWNAAHVYAAALDHLDTGAATRARLDARSRWQDDAVRLLDRALFLTPSAERAAFWRQCIQTNYELRPIQASAAYARLAAKYGQSPAKR